MKEIYLIPDPARIEESIQLTEEYQAFFEYNDFFAPGILEDKQKMERLLAFYESLGRDRSHDTIHGAFLDITVHSEDKRIREASEYRIRQCMEIASRLGVRGVVFHTNTIPNFREDYYRQNWLQTNEAFFRKITEEYSGIEILMENVFDEEPDLLMLLAERMKSVTGFGVCFDYAHGVVFGHDIRDWVEKLSPYTAHMHINDNNLRQDLHKSVGSGQIDWKQFDQFMKGKGFSASVLIEVKQLESQRQSLEFMKEHGIYPF